MNIVEYAKMRKMFGGSGGGDLDALIDGSLTEITSNTESVRAQTFHSCKNLVSVNLPKAISVGNNTFGDCQALTTVNCPSLKFVGDPTPSATSYSFRGCTALEIINLPLVENIGMGAFSGCSALTSVNLPSVTILGDQVFANCSALTSVNLPNFTNVDSTRRAQNLFEKCTALTTIRLPSLKKTVYRMFGYCSNLTRVDFPLATQVGSDNFYCCYNLTALILRSETKSGLSNTNAFYNCYHFHGTVNATYNPDGLKDGYIYVPRALIDSYKVATNWVTFADQFRALEDYTVDGTTTGELDESKVSL